MIPFVRGTEISQSPRGRKSTRGYQGLEKGGADRISIRGNEKVLEIHRDGYCTITILHNIHATELYKLKWLK